MRSRGTVDGKDASMSPSSTSKPPRRWSTSSQMVRKGRDAATRGGQHAIYLALVAKRPFDRYRRRPRDAGLILCTVPDDPDYVYLDSESCWLCKYGLSQDIGIRSGIISGSEIWTYTTVLSGQQGHFL